MDRDPAQLWTRDRVEAELIDAFRRMPSTPVYRVGRAVRTPSDDRNAVTDVLEWAGLLDRDPDGRTWLWAWARCQATCSSFAELCRDMPGWSQSAAERGRRRAAETIAAALNGREPIRLPAAAPPPHPTSPLDSGKGPAVVSGRLTDTGLFQGAHLR